MSARDYAAQPLLRSRFFWKLCASYAAVLVVTGLLVGWQVRSRVSEGLLVSLQDELSIDCQILSSSAVEALQADRSPDLQAELERLRLEAGIRVTVIRHDGYVVGDSDEDPGQMDDHSNRPEIVMAGARPFGVSRRASHTVGYEMVYVALRLVGEHGTLGYVRVAMPVTEIDGELAAVGRTVFFGTGAGVLAAMILGAYFARRITHPLADMTRTASDLAAGRYDSRVRVVQGGELGLLGETLNQLGGEVTRRIAALSQEDAQLRAILSSMIEGVVAVDDQDAVAFINQAAREQLAIEARPIKGLNLWQLAPIAELEELLARVRRSDAHESLEVDLFRGGRERVFQAQASPFRGGGRGGTVVVLHDITELRRLERIRRDFVANVSHELKTPLTSIQGFVETLLSGALHDEENNVPFLRRIDANVKRLTNLVSDLLSLARIESGQLDVERAAIDWGEILDGVLRLRQPALASKRLALSVEGRARAPRVVGDREALTQVLDNLIDNAIQYTPEEGTITVRLRSREGRGELEVEDSGIGIPDADLDRVFERFYRVDKARARAAGGTGLGLSIVKNLVLRMGGEVRVESTEGVGSTFRVLLPLA